LACLCAPFTGRYRAPHADNSRLFHTTVRQSLRGRVWGGRAGPRPYWKVKAEAKAEIKKLGFRSTFDLTSAYFNSQSARHRNTRHTHTDAAATAWHRLPCSVYSGSRLRSGPY